MKASSISGLLLALITTVPAHTSTVQLDRLANDPRVTRCISSDEGVPRYVTGRLAEAVVPGEEAAATMTFLEDHKAAYGMRSPQAELVLDRIEEDALGNRHVRFNQHHEGLRVVGGDLISHIDAAGDLKTVNGHYLPDIELNTAPTVSSADAANVAAADLESGLKVIEPPHPELVVFPWQGSFHLCWRMLLETDHLLHVWEYFVDAHTGDIVFKANAVKSNDAVGTGFSVLGLPRNHIDVWNTGTEFEMRDNTRQLNNDIHGHQGQMPDGHVIETSIAGATLPGSVAVDADNIWDTETQRPAVDAHVYTGAFYDWMLRELGRNGIDDQGSSMLSTVNWSGWLNGAFWTPTQVVYLMWQPGTRSFAACTEVVAHEWGHGVTDYGSRLVYIWESGALNESFSDMLGAAFEFAHDTLDPGDWLMGKNGLVYGSGIRSAQTPELFGQPSYYKGPYWYNTDGCIPSDGNDYCGVHTNSGVGNKWFYLLSDGDTFRDVTVNGIGVQNAILIAYHANAYYWTSTSDYLDAAIGTYYAAMDLDPTGVWAQEVLLAWHAVAVDVPYAGVTFDFPLGIPRTVQREQPTVVDVTMAGLTGGTPVPGSGQIHYSVDGGAITADALLLVAGDHYQATLPALTCDQTLRYYFSGQESGGLRFYHPDTTAPFSSVVVESTPIWFDDDFEFDEGWSVNGNASAGHWERGVPLSGASGAPPSDYDGSGQCYLTGNTLEDGDVDGGTTNLVSPVIDLDGADGLVRFAWWHHNRCDEYLFANDPLYVYISNDDGDHWTLVDVFGPNPAFDGAWHECEFVVGQFVEPTSQLRLRFAASDIGLPTCVESAIDAVRVTWYACDDYSCGDATGDESITSADVIWLVNYVFKGGLPPIPFWQNGDVDLTGNITAADIIYLVNYVFKGGQAPCST